MFGYRIPKRFFKNITVLSNPYLHFQVLSAFNESSSTISFIFCKAILNMQQLLLANPGLIPQVLPQESTWSWGWEAPAGGSRPFWEGRELHGKLGRWKAPRLLATEMWEIDNVVNDLTVSTGDSGAEFQSSACLPVVHSRTQVKRWAGGGSKNKAQTFCFQGNFGWSMWQIWKQIKYYVSIHLLSNRF